MCADVPDALADSRKVRAAGSRDVGGSDCTRFRWNSDITNADVERSFSTYKTTLSDTQRSFSFETLKTNVVYCSRNRNQTNNMQENEQIFPWEAFEDVVHGFLANRRVENYVEIVNNILEKYHRLGCYMSLKMTSSLTTTEQRDWLADNASSENRNLEIGTLGNEEYRVPACYRTADLSLRNAYTDCRLNCRSSLKFVTLSEILMFIKLAKAIARVPRQGKPTLEFNSLAHVFDG
ncbi:hypothetical protein ANN_14422 [Periplaneta americana]|uniref:Uncharacterized protein n=1 Tax=Periplaneta americana TaxID=6978 RepID=A0ABQ8SW98_PERAM|nr:hypothetical protein ANN_14422 [Periplaneta americana]